MAAPVILVEVSPRRVVDGFAEIVRLAGAGATKAYRYPDAAGGSDQSWRGGIVSLPTIATALSFADGDIGTGGIPQAAEIVWGPARSADLDALAAYFWFDAPIKVRIGPEGASPPVSIPGKVLTATIADGQLRIALADPAAELKKPIPLARYAGTGDLEGPVVWKDRLKERIWGRVWNKPGDPIDSANNIYAFADPTRPLQAIIAVRDKGAAAAALTTLAWQGSAQATLIALRAAPAPQGGGVICPSIACVKWWTQPAGTLSADLHGEIGAGYVETTAGIAAALVSALGGPEFAEGTLAAAIAARPAPVGWVADDDSTAVSAMLDALLGNSSLLWLLDAAGQIVIRQWAWGSSVTAARSEKVTRLDQPRPIHTRKIGYQRNEAPMDRGDIAAIVLASDVVYPDGTPIDELQPAEGGATEGAPPGTPVGDRPAEDLVEQVDEATSAAAALAARTQILETETIPAIDDAIAEADVRITAAKARADAAFTEIEAEATRLDQRIDSVAAEGGYDDTSIYAAVSQVDQAAIVRDQALAQRATTIEGTVDDAEARIATTETALSDGRFATAIRADAIEASVDAAEARIAATETAVSDGRFATAQRATAIETSVDAAEARIASTETAVSDGRFASAQSLQTLEAEYDGTAAMVSQQAGVITGLGQRTAAYIKTLAVAGDNRAQLTLYADANAGAGVDIVGDVAIQGDLVVDGSLTVTQLDRSTMTAYTQGQVSGGHGGASTGLTYVPNLGASMAVRAGGTFFFSFTGYSGNTNSGITANYNSLELLDVVGGVLASIKLPYGTLTSHIAILPNSWGARTVQWRVATRGSDVSYSQVANPNVSLNWSML